MLLWGWDLIWPWLFCIEMIGSWDTENGTRCWWYTKQWQSWLDATAKQLDLPIAKCAVAGVMNYTAGISQILQKHTDHMDTNISEPSVSCQDYFYYSQKEHFTSKGSGFVCSYSDGVHDVLYWKNGLLIILQHVRDYCCYYIPVQYQWNWHEQQAQLQNCYRVETRLLFFFHILDICPEDNWCSYFRPLSQLIWFLLLRLFDPEHLWSCDGSYRG